MHIRICNRAVAEYMGEMGMPGNAVDTQAVKLLRERLLKILKKHLAQLQSNDALCSQKNGAQLLDKQNFCTYCGGKLTTDAAFCPKCGKPTQVETSEALPAPTKPPTESDVLFHFWCGKQYATISVNGTTVRVGQHSDWIVRHGEQFDQFDVMEIHSITREKKLSWSILFQDIASVVLALVFMFILKDILSGMVSGGFDGFMTDIVFLAFSGFAVFGGMISCFDAFSNPLVARTTIYRRRGKVHFYDRLDGKSIWDFLDYVNQYNPGCIRVRPPFSM